ncbi:putative transporter-like protein [Cucumis melo var. makuwa]|uniref:Putative transporter-like protein n=1 Tax=Cucumis melo var. makuwa TaxID=1194695 RepID=A0A5D3C4N7_CUCMM|nr:putative transporter-like protein [Cucumis melo var. makuwa]
MAWKYKVGLILLVAVVVIWVTSAEITQSIFTDYEHPFVVTYVGTSMLVAYLAIAFIKECIMKIVRSHFRTKGNCRKVAEIQSPLPALEERTNQSSNNNNNTTSDKVENRDVQYVVNINDNNNNSNNSSNNNGGCELREAENMEMRILKTEEAKFSTKQIAVLALTIGPIWFVSEYFTNAALARTSVATTTILFSTSGLFTLILDACLERQSLTIVNVVAVVVSMAGVAMTTVGKTWAKDEPQSSSYGHGKHSFVGDAFALLSALTDGLYYVLLKKYAGEEGEKVDMQKFLGYVGLFTLTTLWWLIWPLRAIGIEPKFMIPQSTKVAEVVLANCFVANFVSDYFWAMGVVWTSPLVAALGASLTIPLAMIGDMVLHGRHYSLVYIFGSIQVFLGFIIANFSDWISPKLKLRKKFFNEAK